MISQREMTTGKQFVLRIIADELFRVDLRVKIIILLYIISGLREHNPALRPRFRFHLKTEFCLLLFLKNRVQTYIIFAIY